MSPSVVAFSTMSESASTGFAPSMRQMCTAFPRMSDPFADRAPHDDVYAMLPRVHTSAMYRVVMSPRPTTDSAGPVKGWRPVAESDPQPGSVNAVSEVTASVAIRTDLGIEK